MLELLGVVDLITTETHKPAELRQIVRSIPRTPSPTVYSQVDRAVDYGLMAKSRSEGGYKAVTITLSGYRMLGKNSDRAVKPSEVREGTLTYKQAYHIISELVSSNEALAPSQIKVLMGSLENLINE